MSCSILISIRAHSFYFVSRKQSLSGKFLSMQRDKNCQRAHTLRLFQFCVAFAPRGPTGLQTDYTAFAVQAACSQRAEMGLLFTVAHAGHDSCSFIPNANQVYFVYKQQKKTFHFYSSSSSGCNMQAHTRRRAVVQLHLFLRPIY
jgi:hypothetical protein